MFTGKKDQKVAVTFANGAQITVRLFRQADWSDDFLHARSKIGEWLIPKSELQSCEPVPDPQPGELWKFASSSGGAGTWEGYVCQTVAHRELWVTNVSNGGKLLSRLKPLERLYPAPE